MHFFNVNSTISSTPPNITKNKKYIIKKAELPYPASLNGNIYIIPHPIDAPILEIIKDNLFDDISYISIKLLLKILLSM